MEFIKVYIKGDKTYDGIGLIIFFIINKIEDEKLTYLLKKLKLYSIHKKQNNI